jgi:1-acyl-sn-glycerol-3-phosphate acyltransferase
VASAFLVAWLAVMVLPQRAWRWHAVRGIARVALAVVGAHLTVRGLDRIPDRNAMLVFNHSSYMDAVTLAAALPGEPTFVAKKELDAQIFAGPFLRRLGTLFVARYDIAESVADAEAVTAPAREGRNLVFFPEGTFTRRPGLSAFYLGAFKIAAEAGMPVLPGVIHGTRSMLRGDQWFPRHSALSVEIGEPLQPAGSDFASVLHLRDAARSAILARVGEPDLGELVKPALATS